MAEPAPGRKNAETMGSVAALALIVGFAVWVRWPGFTQGGFASHDVAGILYNAMVLHAGGLPYVDTIEIKAPGCFYLAAALAGEGGRDIGAFQVWANLCGLLSLVAVAAIGWRAWGPIAGVMAAVVYVLHDANLDSMDANYVTWANLPQILAVGACLEARRAIGRVRAAWWVFAGVSCGAAALLKRPDGIVLLVAVSCAAWPPGTPMERGRAVGWLVLGLGLAHFPIAVHYLAQDQLGSLIDGYVLNRWGLRYVAHRGGESALVEGGLATVFFVGLPLMLAGFAVARARRSDWTGPLPWLVAWGVATLAAAAVGLRFYKGYFLASAAPLSLLAAAPWGVLGSRAIRPAWLRMVALVPTALLVYRAGLGLSHMRTDRARVHDAGGRTIADHVAANTAPSDPIWVWGWHLWDVYPYANRLSGSRIYKSLGLLTPPNDDTWRRGASPLQFVDGEYARMLIADLERSRPVYIVLGSTVPHREFEALRELLRSDYRRDRRVRLGRVEFWRLREPPAQPSAR